MLNVCLLRANREYCISKNKAIALLELIKSVSILVTREIRIKPTNQSSRIQRCHATQSSPSLSNKEPRKKASEVTPFVKSRIEVPAGIDENKITTLFNALQADLIACSRPFDELTHDDDDDDGTPSCSNDMEENDYELFFEIGVKVEILRTKSETKKGKRGGWLVAVVQDFDLENDWIKVEFLSEEEKIYKVYVKKYLDDEKLKLKNALY